MSNDTESKIFVFEDIDALSASVTENRENKEDSHRMADFETVMKDMMPISLSDLLNIMDGLLSSDGTICLFTTNHIEKLDPALLRSGRMNKMIEFRYLNANTANAMIKKYLGFEIDDLEDEIKPAEL